MPYKQITQLPDSVKNNLPKHAQEIYKEAFNSAEDRYGEEDRAHRVAWSAVEQKFGVRQARYFGRTKTLFQLLIAASVANLTLVARRVGLMRDRNHLPDGSLYTPLRFICVSLRVRNSVATLGARVFGHASRRWRLVVEAKTPVF
jgi:cation transport regulator